MAPLVSVIVPVAPVESAWKFLLYDLSELPPETELLFVGTQPRNDLESGEIHNESETPSYDWIVSEAGRARQLNTGAKRASGDVLWFLHADSRVSHLTYLALLHSLKLHPNALHYANLRFSDDGPQGMKLNEFGVWFRSHILHIPFGDQGFAISRKRFFELGSFDETVSCGEDHCFLWTARKAMVPIVCTGGVVNTSARKYKQNGWLRNTVRNVWLTTYQSFEQNLTQRHARDRVYFIKQQ